MLIRKAIVSLHLVIVITALMCLEVAENIWDSLSFPLMSLGITEDVLLMVKWRMGEQGGRNCTTAELTGKSKT